MDPSLFKQRVFLVTGAAVGIGFGISKQLATYGAHVYALDVHAAESLELKELKELNSELVHYIQCDVRLREQCHEAVLNVIKTHGRLDGVVNNAGVCEIEGETPDDNVYNNIMETNVRGVWNISTEALVHMKEAGSGSIVNIASTSAMKGEQRLPVYTASKHAVAGLTRTWALDQAKYGIRVNCVAPGPTDTNMARGPIQTVMGPRYPGKKTDDELLALVAQNMPNRRMGQPEDVANMVSFLLSDLSVQIIGQVIAVAGGF